MEQNNINYEFMLQIKKYYDLVNGDGEGSIRKLATDFGISRTKVRKILVTLGSIKSEITDKATELKKQGMTLEQIADELGVSMATVSTYLPYETVLYKPANKSQE